LDKIQDLKDGSGQQGEFANMLYLMFSAGMSNRLLATSKSLKVTFKWQKYFKFRKVKKENSADKKS
jgi:hypothetical protein